MTRFLIGLFVLVTVVTVILSAMYPEQFALALGFFIMGSLLGGMASFYLYRATYQLGSQDNQELAKRQVVNPATIMREARMADKTNNVQQPTNQTQSKAIPRFSSMSGLE